MQQEYSPGQSNLQPAIIRKHDSLPEWAQAALIYANAGLPVFPVHSIDDGKCTCGSYPCGKVDQNPAGKNAGKHPRTKNGLGDATTDEEQIRAWAAQWPHSNVAIAVPDSYAVLDIDARNGGLDSLRVLTQEHGDLSPTLVCQSGSNPPGFHFWMRVPPGTRLPANLDRLERPGVDIKCKGGYLVAPPSLHASGRRYAWYQDNFHVPVSPAPLWLLAMGFESSEQSIVKDIDSVDVEQLWTAEKQDQVAKLFQAGWRDGSKHAMAKAVGGWVKQHNGGIADACKVLKLFHDNVSPSADLNERYKGAAYAWQIEKPYGYSELCAMVGKVNVDEAARIAPAFGNEPEAHKFLDDLLAELNEEHSARDAAKAEAQKPQPGEPWWKALGVNPIDINQEVPPVERLVEGLPITDTRGTFIMGLPGTSKTPTSISLGLAIASGTDWCDRKTVQRPVIHLAFEKADDELRGYVKSVAKGMGITDTSNYYVLPVEGQLLNGKNSFIPNIVAAATALKQQTGFAPVVICDVYSASVAGLKVNESEYADPLRALLSALRPKGCAVLIAAHCAKSKVEEGDEPTRGSLEGTTQLLGAANTAIGLSQPNFASKDFDTIKVNIVRRINSADRELTFKWNCAMHGEKVDSSCPELVETDGFLRQSEGKMKQKTETIAQRRALLETRMRGRVVSWHLLPAEKQREGLTLTDWRSEAQAGGHEYRLVKELIADLVKDGTLEEYADPYVTKIVRFKPRLATHAFGASVFGVAPETFPVPYTGPIPYVAPVPLGEQPRTTKPATPKALSFTQALAEDFSVNVPIPIEALVSRYGDTADALETMLRPFVDMQTPSGVLRWNGSGYRIEVLDPRGSPRLLKAC